MVFNDSTSILTTVALSISFDIALEVSSSSISISLVFSTVSILISAPVLPLKSNAYGISTVEVKSKSSSYLEVELCIAALRPASIVFETKTLLLVLNFQ